MRSVVIAVFYFNAFMAARKDSAKDINSQLLSKPTSAPYVPRKISKSDNSDSRENQTGNHKELERSFLTVAETRQGSPMFLFVAEKQFDVAVAHRFTVKIHRQLRILRSFKANVGFASGPSITAIGQDNGFQDRIVGSKEFENILLGRAERKSSHSQETGMVPNLNSTTSSLVLSRSWWGNIASTRTTIVSSTPTASRKASWWVGASGRPILRLR